MREFAGLVVRAGFLLVLAGVLVGCVFRNDPIPEPSPISVPGGLSSEAVGTALRRAIIQTGGRDFRGHPWIVEEDRPGELVVSTRPRSHYLRVAVEYDASRVITRIIDGENLRYSERFRRIHGNAIGWVNQLEEHLQRTLYEASLNQHTPSG